MISLLKLDKFVRFLSQREDRKDNNLVNGILIKISIIKWSDQSEEVGGEDIDILIKFLFLKLR